MSIKKQVINGVRWTTLSSIVLAISAILRISILARYLDKVDFGLIAIVMFFLGFMELFNDMGLTSAILHKQDITKEEYSSLYWLNFFLSLSLYLLLCLITPAIAAFYDQEQLNILVPLLGTSLIFSGIGRQFKVIKQKNLDFRQISVVDIVAALLSLCLALYLAIMGYGVFSLVYSTIFQFLFSNIAYILGGFKKHIIAAHFNFGETRPFLRIGLYQVGGQIANYFNRDLDILLVGKLFSTDVLGGYSLAKQLVFRPYQIINPILVKVASPALARYQENREALKSNYLKLVNIVASINIPIYIGVMLFAPFIVHIMYGDGFEHIILLVRLLSIYMIFRAVSNPVGSLVIASGRTDLEFGWNIVCLFVMPVFIVIGAQMGIVEVTICLCLAMLALYYPSWKLLINRITGANFKEYLKASFLIDFMIMRELADRSRR